MVATSKYLDNYFGNRSNIFVPRSIDDDMSNSAYKDENGRHRINEAGYGYNEIEKVQELVAVYYGMIEEVDTHIGNLISTLEVTGQRENTLVVLTSDHGEMVCSAFVLVPSKDLLSFVSSTHPLYIYIPLQLGSHGMVGKGVLLEEATRVPLAISFPKAIVPGNIVSEPVSHLDVFATIMDYFGASDLDGSDGTSLRQFIEKKSYNALYDESVVVFEMDKRYPVDSETFSRFAAD